MCELLVAPDARIVAVALEGLENILEYGARELNARGENAYALLISECGGVERIEALQDHPNPTLYDKAYNIIDKYFQGQDADAGVVAADAASFARPGAGGPDGGYSW
jgi:importin subunit alpha-6/7